jgi:hypothetical protein
MDPAMLSDTAPVRLKMDTDNTNCSLSIPSCDYIGCWWSEHNLEPLFHDWPHGMDWRLYGGYLWKE